MRISQIAKITGAKVYSLKDATVKRFIINSKEAKEGDFFVPLKGSKVDGHDFIDDAIKNKAVGSFSSKELKKENILIVEDTLKALTDVARYKKSLIKTKIAITGTAGKTTTKELIAFTMSKFEDVYYTKGNYNNQIGLPLTLANIDKDYNYGVFELGASRKGDIEHLSDILNQDIAIITNVGYGHIEGYKDWNELLNEKLNILKPAKEFIINENLKKYTSKNTLTFGYSTKADAQILDVSLTKSSTTGKIKVENEVFDVEVPFFNEKIVENVAILFLLFKVLGFPLNKVPEVLRGFKPLNGRGNIVKIGNLTIIDDTYNANPTSVLNAIGTLSKLKGKKILILGDMLELGKLSEEKHREIGKKILQTDIEKVFLFGEEVKYIYDEIKDKKEAYILEKEKIADHLKSLKEPYFVLIKGSRSMKMEEVIQLLS